MSNEDDRNENDGAPWTVRSELQRLRSDVDGLREYRAAQRVRDDNQADAVDKLTIAVDALQKTIDTSRGALWVISGVAGLIGACGGFLGALWSLATGAHK